MELSKEEQEAIEKLEQMQNFYNEFLISGVEFSTTLNQKDIRIMIQILNLISKLQKENDELKNHIHYKKCLACGKEFKAKRKDAKYCVYCSKFMNNRNYYMNLTEEQKAKRREQAKLSMRKLRSKNG